MKDINNMTIAIVDIETTGFLHNGGTIVEIGIAKLDTKTGEVTTIFDALCTEAKFGDQDRDAWIFNNSTLKFSEVSQAPHLSTMFDEVQAAIDSCDAATAYNKKFDFDFLTNRGFSIPNQVTCPMLAATPVCRLPAPRGRGHKWPKVEEAWNFLFPEIEYVELHRGADDAVHEAQILMELIKRGVIHVEAPRQTSGPNHPFVNKVVAADVQREQTIVGDGTGEALPVIEDADVKTVNVVADPVNPDAVAKTLFKINKVEQLALESIQKEIHHSTVQAGWWDNFTEYEERGDLATLASSKISLIHSEVSEALEGVRKDLKDDHLPHRLAFEVELADAMIRILDLAAAFDLDVAGAMAEKFAYNQERADHKRENRAAEGGKKI